MRKYFTSVVFSPKPILPCEKTCQTQIEGYSIFCSFFFQGLHLWHMDVARPGVEESELQLPAYATATAAQDLSRICILCHSLWQSRILSH